MTGYFLLQSHEVLFPVNHATSGDSKIGNKMIERNCMLMLTLQGDDHVDDYRESILVHPQKDALPVHKDRWISNTTEKSNEIRVTPLLLLHYSH